MKRFLGIAGLAAITVAIAYFAFARRGAQVDTNSTLYLRVHLPLPETESTSLLSPLVGNQPTLAGVVATIRHAARDSRIKNVVITPETDGAMWGQLQELREALVEVKKAGKPVVAFLESGAAPEYYVASVADRIVLMPAGELELSGLATYELFFRGTLDKLGIFPDLLHIGDYKTYSNTFTESSMTAAHREMDASLNRDMYDELVRAVAEGRKMTETAAKAALDAGPYLPDAALRAGLIDDIGYEDQLDDKAPIQGTKRVTGDDYGPGDGAGFGAPRIALLYAVGEIASGHSAFDRTGGLVLGSETFVDWIRTARADKGVKAIVIRIDSPGGSAIATEVIWRELMLTRDVKPVIVSMGDVAGSGGYYMALPAHAIVAQPGTLTGSIGVVTGKFVVKGALDKLGVGTGVVTDGANAELNSPFREFTPAERQKIEAMMQSTYEDFVARVAQARGTTPQKIDAIAQGRVWTGRQARELGLVDALGGLDEAILLAKARAHIDAGRTVRLDIYPPRRGLLDVIANPFGGAAASMPRPFDRAAAMLDQLSRFKPGEPLMLMTNGYR